MYLKYENNTDSLSIKECLTKNVKALFFDIGNICILIESGDHTNSRRYSCSIIAWLRIGSLDA